MNLEGCIAILTEHNKWRRGVGKYEKLGVGIPHTAERLGEAIDYAIEELHRLKGLEK